MVLKLLNLHFNTDNMSCFVILLVFAYLKCMGFKLGLGNITITVHIWKIFGIDFINNIDILKELTYNLHFKLEIQLFIIQVRYY